VCAWEQSRFLQWHYTSCQIELDNVPENQRHCAARLGTKMEHTAYIVVYSGPLKVIDCSCEPPYSHPLSAPNFRGPFTIRHQTFPHVRKWVKFEKLCQKFWSPYTFKFWGTKTKIRDQILDNLATLRRITSNGTAYCQLKSALKVRKVKVKVKGTMRSNIRVRYCCRRRDTHRCMCVEVSFYFETRRRSWECISPPREFLDRLLFEKCLRGQH